MKYQESVRFNVSIVFRLSLHLIISLLIILNISPITLYAKSNTISPNNAEAEDVIGEGESPFDRGHGGAVDDGVLPADWWTAVQDDISHSEYNVTWQDKTYLPDGAAAYHAPNRAHNLRTYFTESSLPSPVT